MRKDVGIILVAMITMLSFITPCQASPDEYLIWYHEQYNEDGTSLMIVWLYKMAEAEPNYDFYIIKIRIVGMQSSVVFYERADIWSNGVCNDWEPKSGIYYSPVSLSMTVGGVGFGINIPAETVGTTEGLMPTFGWQCRTVLGSPDKEFVSSWYVPDGVDFAFLVAGSEWYSTISGDDICLDAIYVYYPYEFDFKKLTISAGSHGTTSPKPGEYKYYPVGFVGGVWGRPYSGYSFDYWVLDGATKSGNPITVTMDSDHNLKAYFEGDSSEGTLGCPTLFVWSGIDYADEGILDIHADSDVTVRHEIENPLDLEDGGYRVQLRELDNFTSHIDQVRLYAVDDEGEEYLCPLTHAYHSELDNVKHMLQFDDDTRVDLKPTERIDLRFGPPECQIEHFIFEINGYNPKPLEEAW